MPNISLDQWLALITVVETGGYAQAAQKLCKSQSAISYAVQKIEAMLGVKAFEIQGRKAILTPTGQMLYRQALRLVNDAQDLERAAHRLSAGWEAVIHVAVEVLFPTECLLACLSTFGQESPHTRIELIESVLGGTSEALIKGEVDLAISPQLPLGFLGDLLLRVPVIAVAHAQHPLNQSTEPLTNSDLQAYRHIVVRDSGVNRDSKAISVEVKQRWTVSQIASSIQAVREGYGFAWLPQSHIQRELDAGILKPLPLREGVMREIPLYLILAKPEFSGPGVKRLADIIKTAVS
jgi:DNA-binding transcriptional LysR family regulator